ncbi:hypothetical protein F2Q69_00043797 [Brassica cretica]|uniref:F-box domain-containing protein n=1 Tax=Brassica cretica TaxID=69181 RepID=A0A8S9NPN7_BRACR|nr:hypothetical protein F2Q69_00043797 [Brassica cretica]
MQDSETGEIPEDLMIEIAARLPAKSVMRFKCISKFWSSLPLSTHFCNRFLTYQSQQPRFYMSKAMSSGGSVYAFVLIQLQ